MPSLDALKAAAAEQAGRLQSEFIGTEHLFLAWLTWARGPIADAISAAGLNAESFQEVLAKGSKRARGRRGGPAPGEGGALTSHAQRVLETALERGRAAGREEPGTDDLILAMVQEPRGAIARALTEFDIKPSRLKALASDRPARGGRGSQQRTQSAATTPPARPPAEPAPAPAPAPKPGRARPAAAPAAAPPQEQAQPPAAVEGRGPREAAPESRLRPSLDLGTRRRFGLLSPLYLAAPVALGLHFTNGDARWVALAAALGAIPLSGLLGEATEQLVARSRPLPATLLGAVLCNASMVAFAVAALRHGEVALATASVAGSLLAAVVLVPALGSLARGGRVGFGAESQPGLSALVVLAAALLLVPTLVDSTVPGGALGRGLLLPETIAAVMAVALLATLALSWRSDRPIFGGMQWFGSPPNGAWSTVTAAGLAVLGLVGVAAMAELLLSNLATSGTTALVSPVFLGLILLPLLGSVPQLGTAVTAAARGHHDLAVQQVATTATMLVLAAVPTLVVVAGLLQVAGFDLVFDRYQALLLAGGGMVAALVIKERDSTGVDGVLLLAGYVMAAVVAWFI